MATNTHGTLYHHRGRERDAMRDFDRLPKKLRQALANSDHNWSATQVHLKLNKIDALRTVAVAVRTIAETDVNKHIKDAKAGIIMPGQRSKGA